MTEKWVSSPEMENYQERFWNWFKWGIEQWTVNSGNIDAKNIPYLIKKQRRPIIGIDRYYHPEAKLSSKFLENLVAKGIGRKETFWSIIQSYAWAKNIDFNQISTVIEHEHASFPYQEIFKDFTEPNIIMIYRDPRASIAGFYKNEGKISPQASELEFFTFIRNKRNAF